MSDKSGREHRVDDSSWVVGDGGYENLPETTFKPRRFWIDAEEERKIVFLDGDGLFSKREPFPFFEHNIEINGKWGNFETCVSGKKDGKCQCYLCSPRMRGVQKISKSFIGAFTVIQTTPWKVKKGKNKGKIVRNSKQLFCAKHRALKVLKKKLERTGILVGAEYNAYRPDKDAPNTGTDFEFIRSVVDPEWVKEMAALDQKNRSSDGFDKVMDAIAKELGMEPKEVEPYDYLDVFKPRSWEELEADYAFLASRRSGDDEDEEEDDDDEKGEAGEKKSSRRGEVDYD